MRRCRSVRRSAPTTGRRADERGRAGETEQLRPWGLILSRVLLSRARAVSSPGSTCGLFTGKRIRSRARVLDRGAVVRNRLIARSPALLGLPLPRALPSCLTLCPEPEVLPPHSPSSTIGPCDWIVNSVTTKRVPGVLSCRRADSTPRRICAEQLVVEEPLRLWVQRRVDRDHKTVRMAAPASARTVAESYNEGEPGAKS